MPTLPRDRSQNHTTRQTLILCECLWKPQQPTAQWWWAPLWSQTQSDEKELWQRESRRDEAWIDWFVREIWTAASLCKRKYRDKKTTVNTLLYGRDGYNQICRHVFAEDHVEIVLWRCNYKSLNVSCEDWNICQNLICMCRKSSGVITIDARCGCFVSVRSECKTVNWGGGQTTGRSVSKAGGDPQSPQFNQSPTVCRVLSLRIKMGQRSNANTLRAQSQDLLNQYATLLSHTLMFILENHHGNQ